MPIAETIKGMEEIPFSGDNLKKKRLSLRLSRMDVSKGTGLAASLIQSYEAEEKDPGRKKLALIGAYFSQVSGTHIKFSCEWDKDVINEYAAFEMPQERLDQIKAAIRND